MHCRLNTSESAQKLKSAAGLFARSAKFRFSGRCEREVTEEASSIQRTEPRFERAPSTRIAAEIRSRRPPSVRDDNESGKPAVLLSSTLIDDGKSDTETECARDDVSKRTSSVAECEKRSTRTSTESHGEQSELIVSATARNDSQASPNDDAAVALASEHKRAKQNHSETALEDDAPQVSVLGSLASALLRSFLLFGLLLFFLALLYETEFVEQAANRFGFSLRNSALLDRLAQLTYKPIKRLASSALGAK